MSVYQPGTHIIATLESANIAKLQQFGDCKKIIDGLIGQYALNNLGEVYHNFSPAGFTAVVCLSESHISIHTWPEYNKVNLDIYLSNFQRNNDGTVQAMLDALVAFFEATIIDFENLKR